MTQPESPMYRLFHFLKNYKKSVIWAVTSSVINKIFDLMPPILTAWIIDTAAGEMPGWVRQWGGDEFTQNTVSVLVFFGVLTLLIFGFESLFEWSFKKEFMRLAQRVQHDLRMVAYGKMQSREIAFFEEQRTGNLMAMLNDDINQLERFLNTSFNEIIQLIVLVLFAGWSLIAVNVPLGLLGMLPIPFIVLGSFYYQKKVAPYYKEVREAVGKLSNRLENNISGIMVIKSFTAESFEKQRVNEVSENYQNANFRAIRWSSVYIPIIRMIIAVGFAGTLVIGAYWAMQTPPQFSLGSLAFFAMMIQRLLWPITRLGSVFDEFERARASARRVFGLIDTPNVIQNPTNPKKLPVSVGNIKLDGVEFSYKKGIPILDKLNLEIKKGQNIGIAGLTGAGKTTLIKLLLRLYDVTGGFIKLEGIDLRDLDMKELRRNIALVSQEVYLFHGTIRENIAYGMGELPMHKIQEAAEKAQLHEFIVTLPNGYDSIIGERGIKLSGGQRQRLSIARAILKDAPILILDEATSSVDMETEKAIQENLEYLTQDRTAIIIAHRLSTIRNADQIIVLKDGRILEKGNHEELIETKGLYSDLWEVQMG
jgi:ATP-binding cassette subfamily B protein